MDPATAEGGALRAQDIRTTSDPTGLNGAIIRVDPVTGAGKSDNPGAGSADPNIRRIIAYGLRNPFRFTQRPGTDELWIGDVGWDVWEEIDRIADPNDSVVENFGWPCYEATDRQAGYDGSNIGLCESLYPQGTGVITMPWFKYNHAANIVAGETCTTGGSAIAGLTFYPESGGSFPAAYQGGLFFADHNRNCIWFIPKGANGQPDLNQLQVFLEPAANPTDIVIGPGGDLYYPDFDGSTIRRVSPTTVDQPPTAHIVADPENGPAPLTVDFDGTTSTDPEHGPLTYRWDLDGDGQYDDSTAATPSFEYDDPGDVTVGLEVKDAGGKTGTTTNVIAVSVPPNTPPVPVIANPTVGTTWSVGDPIDFAGSATDAQDGSLPASALSWSIILHHCPSNCHTHTIESHPGVASGTFDAPDHDYPSFLEFKLTATDSDGASASVSRNLDPRTADVSFATIPTGLQLSVGTSTSTSPFTRTVIDGSNNSIGAQTQVKDGVTYVFTGWSDGKAASHNITATDGASYTATFTADATGPTGTVSINGGATTTTARQVTLSVPATDALTGVAAVRLSDDGSTWVTRAYAASQAWTLPAVGGTRTVYVQWRDGAGNWSSTASDSITLDGAGPTVSGFQRSFVAGTTISADKIRLRLSWTGTDAVTGVARYEMQQRTDGGAWTSISTSITSPTFDRALATGHTYAFQVRGVDHAGNAGAWVATPIVRIFGTARPALRSVTRESGRMCRAACTGTAHRRSRRRREPRRGSRSPVGRSPGWPRSARTGAPPRST